MNTEVVIAVFTVLCSIIGALVLIVVSRVMKQGDDTNTKVTDQGIMLADIKGKVDDHEKRLGSLHTWRGELQLRELNAISAENAELRRVQEEERREYIRRQEDRSA